MKEIKKITLIYLSRSYRTIVNALKAAFMQQVAIGIYSMSQEGVFMQLNLGHVIVNNMQRAKPNKV